jgi:magnesium-dependent phosphatase-1
MEGGGAAASSAAASVPRVVVFDLDGCVWYPEMYMLWGGGAPFKAQSNGDLTDNAGQKCHLMGAVREIMHTLKTDSAWGQSHHHHRPASQRSRT